MAVIETTLQIQFACTLPIMSSVDDFGDDNDSSAKGGAVRRLLLSRQMARSGQDSEPEASSTASEPGGVGITTRRTTVKKDDKQRGQSSTQAVMGNQPKKENSVDNPNFPTRTSNETIEQECQEPHLTTTSPQAKPSAESLTQLERIHNPKLPTSRPQDWNSTATQPFSDSNIKSGDKFNTFPNAEQDSLTRPGAVAIQGVLNDSSRSNVANVMDRESSNLPLPAPPPPPPPGNRQEPSMPLLQAVPVPRAEENEPDKVIAAAQLVQGTVLSPQMKRWLIAGLLLVIAVAIFLSVTLSRRSSSSSSAKSIGDATTAPTLSLAPSFSPTGAPTLVQYPFTTTDELRVAVAEYFSQDGSNTSQLAARYGYPINTWNVGMIQDFNRLFSGQSNFNEPIHQWDMSNAKNLRLMFEGKSRRRNTRMK